MGIQTLIEVVEEVKEKRPIENILMRRLLEFFSIEQSLKRHLKEIHSSKAKIYFKHDQVDGRQQCTTCMKSYIYSAKVKKQMQNNHLSKFLIQDKGDLKLVPAKRKLKIIESQRELQELLKRQSRFETMNLPAENTALACFQMKAMNIPALNAVDLSSCIENYLRINVPAKAKLKVNDEYAYKVFPFSYLLKNEQYQNKFANKQMIIREAQRRDSKNLLKQIGVILSYSFIEPRLKKFEMILRDYLYHNKYPDDLNYTLTDMIKGVKELQQLGYVHRDLKTENVMLNLCPQEEDVIDFNRALRQDIVTLVKRFLALLDTSQLEKVEIMAQFSGIFWQLLLLFQSAIWKVCHTLEQITRNNQQVWLLNIQNNQIKKVSQKKADKILLNQAHQ